MTPTRRLPCAILALTVALGCGGALAERTPRPQPAPAKQPSQAQLTLPNQPDSLKFAVIGDTGTGDQHQYAVAEKLIAFRNQFKYEFLVMMGDNTYGGESAADFERRFERPYKPLIDAGLKFYAALGNHDTPNQKNYKLFNMGGQQYYTFRPKPGVRFFALDSNYMSPEQLTWLQKELAASGSDWKIAFFHHPLYSSGGRHGSDAALRDQLEPLFLKYSVDVVLAGHDHFYERIKPQKGIYHFVVGGSAKLRQGDIGTTGLTAKGFDTGYSFMAVEIAGDVFHFQTISDKGVTVDSGALKRRVTQTK
jgi:predicted phosphodiesterase